MSGEEEDLDSYVANRPLPTPPKRAPSVERLDNYSEGNVESDEGASTYSTYTSDAEDEELNDGLVELDVHDDESIDYQSNEQRPTLQRTPSGSDLSARKKYDQNPKNTPPKSILKKTGATPISGLQIQKTQVCAQCSVPIMYTPNYGKDTQVRCYNCPHVNTFIYEEEDPDVVESNTYANAKNNRGGKSLFNKKVKGAFKTLKKKAAELQERAENSNFMDKAREKAAAVAHKTKSLAQKASAQTQKFAQKAFGNNSNEKENPNERNSGSSQENTVQSPPAMPNRGPPPKPVPRDEIPMETLIFRVTLDEAVRKSAKINPYVPDFVTNCIDYIRKKGLKEEGIFRLSGSSRQISELRDNIDRGKSVDLFTVLDQHVISGVLKLYFRELPETLFTNRLMMEFKKAEREPVLENQLSKFQAVVNNLPATNRAVLHELMKLLNEVSLNSGVNKMTVSNLAIVFSATLGCTLETITPLIQHQEKIFGGTLIEF